MPAPPSTTRSRVPWVLAGGVVLLLAVAGAYQFWPASAPPNPDGPPPSAPLPPLTPSPFANTKPGVAYIGDESCATCHPDHVASYHRHSMGQSLFTTAEAPPLERFEAAAGNPMQSGRFRFQVVRDGSRVVHKEWCEDARGTVVAAVESEIAFAVGSGAHARSYIHARDGFLFQSPLTWYTQKGRWDLSPGYEQNLLHFHRPIDPRCLYCHSQGAAAVPHTANRYHEPVFTQRTIGCERCHGPGQLHLDFRADGLVPDGPDRTIVNPKHLPPALRENVCEQCHLQGEAIVVRRGRAQADYRPGLPLHEYVNVFVRKPTDLDATRIVGHVEQMHQSACFQKSGGKFGCTSCHDPHGLPPPEKKVAFYRDRCRTCHDPAPPASDRSVPAPECSVSAAERTAQAPGDNCAQCHMPHRPSSSVTHVALSDHRVIRRPDRPPVAPADPGGDDLPLRPFHRHLQPEDPERPRDLGLALTHLASIAEGLRAERVSDRLGQWALPLLDGAVARAPDDLPAREARGFFLNLRGRRDEALADLDAALAQAPDREATLALAALVAESKDDLERAEQYARRLTAVAPFSPDHQHRLASILSKRQKWPDALAAARAALRANPFHPDARALLINALLETGDQAAARVEFDVLGTIHPEHHDRLKSWFAERLRRTR
jgi:hypothetical protein